MWRKTFIIVMVFVSAMILLTQATWASEEQIMAGVSADDSVAARIWTDSHGVPSPGPAIPCDVDCLTGTWKVLLRSAEESDKALGEKCWAGGKVRVGPGGIIEEGMYVDCKGHSLKIMGGRFTISPGCTVKGKIVTSQGTLYAIPGGPIVGDRLVLMTSEYHPANRFEREQVDVMLEDYREDIRGVLRRIRQERQLKDSGF